MSWDALPIHIADELDRLNCGTVFLTVPILGEAIQVGAADRLAMTTIEVRTTPRTVTVRRTDGNPLQARIVHRGQDGAVFRTPVFTEPVAELRLRRLARPLGAPLWLVASRERIRRSSDLLQLITTIVTFGVAKQNHDRVTARMADRRGDQAVSATAASAV